MVSKPKFKMMNTSSDLEQKYEALKRIRQIDGQLKVLSAMGGDMCNKAHCQVEVDMKLTDLAKKQRAKATVDIDLEDKIFNMMMTGHCWYDNEEEYSEQTKIKLSDSGVIRLIGFLMGELKMERDALTTTINEG